MKKCIYVSQNRDKIYSVPKKGWRPELIETRKILYPFDKNLQKFPLLS